jgi:hypothetical protein
MTRVEQLIGEELYGVLAAEGVTSESFVAMADRITIAHDEGVAEGTQKMLERVRRSVVTRYYPDAMNGGKLEPLQCLDSNVLKP